MAQIETDPEQLLADKGYDSDAVRRDVEARGGEPLIPTKINRKAQIVVQKALYRLRNRIDIDQTWRLSRIKRWRVWVDVGKQGATEWQGCCAGGFELGDCRRIRGDELVEGPLYFDRAAA
jgi:hypothetical protein